MHLLFFRRNFVYYTQQEKTKGGILYKGILYTNGRLYQRYIIPQRITAEDWYIIQSTKKETESRILYRNNTSGILYKISRKIFCAFCTEKHKKTK